MIHHHGHCMGYFVFNATTGWSFDCGFNTTHGVNVGWGSVSDQNGMNKILRGTGWYYSRKGGAHYLGHDDGKLVRYLGAGNWALV
jgi:hypothetical protein